MARGNSKSAIKGQAFYAKLTGLKEGEQVHFQLTRKNPNGDGYIADGTEKVLTGYLVGAYHDTWTYQGVLKDKCKIALNDTNAGTEGETYYVEFSPSTSIGRGIINALLGTENYISPVKLSLYNNKDNGRASIGMYIGNERMNWKFGIDDMNKYVSQTTEKVKDSSGKVTTVTKKNFVELNEFLLNEFKTKMVAKFEGGNQTKNDSQDIIETQVASTSAGDDDLPF